MYSSGFRSFVPRSSTAALRSGVSVFAKNAKIKSYLPEFCVTGGTIFMSRFSGSYKPAHKIIDVVLSSTVIDAHKKKIISDDDFNKMLETLSYGKLVEAELEGVVATTQDQSLVIQRISKNVYRQIARDLNDKGYWDHIGLEYDEANLSSFGQKLLKYFGVSSRIHQPLGDIGIDSLNFDVGSHYRQILGSVLTIFKDHQLSLESDSYPMPVIVGGTDTLKYYATLMAEDLKMRGFNSPILFLSSMKAFGDDVGHVSRIFEAAQLVTNLLYEKQMAGSYMLTAADNDMNQALLYCLNYDVEKVSATKNPAFFGESLIAKIDLQTSNVELVNDSLLKVPRLGKFKLHSRMVDVLFNPVFSYFEKLSFDNNLFLNNVLPPIYGYNDINVINKFFLELLQQNSQDSKDNNVDFNAVIISSMPDLENIDDQSRNDFLTLISFLKEKNIAVIVANNPYFNGYELVRDANFATSDSAAYLRSSGAILMDCSSQRAHILASLNMGYFADFHEENVGYLGSFTEFDVTNNARFLDFELNDDVFSREFLGKELAVEYVPCKKSYQKMLEICHKSNISDVISCNCLSGGAASEDVIDPVKFPGITIYMTSPYASLEEVANLGSYGAADKLKDNSQIVAGGSVSPLGILQDLRFQKKSKELIAKLDYCQENKEIMFEAIFVGDIDRVKTLYEENDLMFNNSDRDNNSVLHLACSNSDNIEIVEYILLNRPDLINTKNYSKVTPIMMACLVKSQDIVEKLIKDGADINVEDSHGLNLFDYLINYEDDFRGKNSDCVEVKILNLLIDNGLVLNELDREKLRIVGLGEILGNSIESSGSTKLSDDRDLFREF